MSIFFFFVSIRARPWLAYLPPRAPSPSTLSRYIPDTYPTHTRYIRIFYEYSTNTPHIYHEYLIQIVSMSFTRARAYFNIYTRAYVYTLLISVRTLLVLIDNQLFTRKMMFFSIFSARKFGQSKKNQYLCTRFAPEVSELQNGKIALRKRNADNQPLTKKVMK